MTVPNVSIAHLRCFNHGNREAVAQCLACSRYYCRECVTEHGSRVLCAACLSSAAMSTTPRKRIITVAWRAVQLAAGFLIVWLAVYAMGRGLLWLPSEFHDQMIWEREIFSEP